jgi:hypothetical protein
MRKVLLLLAAGVLVTAGSPSYASRPTPDAKPVAGTSCRAFPSDSWWHADVSGLPVHARSQEWLSHMSTDVDLHPDFGPSYGAGPDYGIPVTVVAHSHRRVRVRFDYASESDRVRYPLGRDTRIEGGRGSEGDKHAIVVDQGSCRLFETWNTRLRGGRWVAGSGAVWSLRSNALRPQGWTSADAAGLPILPGLLRWNEVRSGEVDHAIRFSTDVTSRHHLWPARHDAGSVSDRSYPPMGARFRLSASFPISSYRKDTQVVLRAMKRHGLVLADNGQPWFFQGTRDARWRSAFLDDLKRIPASAFVAVDTASLQVRANSARVRRP